MIAFNCHIHKGVTVPGAVFTKNQDPTGYALWLSVASFPGSPQLVSCVMSLYIMQPKSWEGAGLAS